MELENLTKEELVCHIAEMNAEMLELQEELRQSRDQADWVAGSMKARTRVLNERIKELNCVYQVFQIFRDPGLRFEQRVGRIVDILPRAWQYPDLAGARAVVGSQEFRTPRFRETPWVQKERISAKGHPEGIVEVCYLQERPAADEGPFLREERMLLKVAAECLGAICELDRLA